MTTLPAVPAAIRTEVAEATVTVLGPPAVTAWTSRYFAPWWQTTEVVPFSGSRTDSDLVVAAYTDADQYQDLADLVAAEPHRTASYARSPLHVIPRSDGSVLAIAPEQKLAYRSFRSPSEGRMLDIIGCDTEPVATATARLAREMVRGRLLRVGWCLLHASAVTRYGRAVLTLGGKGAGKTTTAVSLARRTGWKLLANDRVFIRPDHHTGRLRVLPWPAAVAVGLGLLDALEWTDIVRARLADGEALHPTQDLRVTEALHAGRSHPLWDGSRELKAQIWPHQIADWFGVDLAHDGQVAALLFPGIDPDGSPRTAPHMARAIEESDWLAGKTEDRYPDVFGLAGVPLGGTDIARDLAIAELRGVLHQGLTLTHDIEANTNFLDQHLNDYLAKLTP